VESHPGVVERVRSALPPLFEMITPMPCTALQQMFDEAYAWGVHAYEKYLYLESFTDEAIDVIVERAAGTASPMSVVHFYVPSGAFCTADDEEPLIDDGRNDPGEVGEAGELGGFARRAARGGRIEVDGTRRWRAAGRPWCACRSR
jgi:hypothetical protein